MKTNFKSKIALIAETVGDRAKRLKFGTFWNISKKIPKFLKNIKKHKFALISEMVRAKQTKFGSQYIVNVTAKYFSTF